MSNLKHNAKSDENKQHSAQSDSGLIKNGIPDRKKSFRLAIYIIILTVAFGVLLKYTSVLPIAKKNLKGLSNIVQKNITKSSSNTISDTAEQSVDNDAVVLNNVDNISVSNVADSSTDSSVALANADLIKLDFEISRHDNTANTANSIYRQNSVSLAQLSTSINFLHKETQRARECIVGLEILKRAKRRLEDGLDYRFDISLLQKRFLFVDDLIKDIDFSVVVSRLDIMKQLVKMADSSEFTIDESTYQRSSAKNDDALNNNKKGCSDFRNCFFSKIKSNFGVRYTLSQQRKLIIKETLDTQLTYLSFLKLLNSSEYLRNPDYSRDVERALKILSRLDQIEEKLLQQCI
ncbi:MAG: hypothetical protein JJW01_00890 [Alphaproteobacteria bacterium]|nr:hypothetical protein [Rickettsiales bacterium]